MSRKNHRLLSDLIGDKLWWLVRCKNCKHQAKLNPRDMQQKCYRSNYSPALDRLIGHLKCSKCKSKQLWHGPCYPDE